MHLHFWSVPTEQPSLSATISGVIMSDRPKFGRMSWLLMAEETSPPRSPGKGTIPVGYCQQSWCIVCSPWQPPVLRSKRAMAARTEAC